MGTHVSSPSKIATSGDLLSDHLKQNQNDIGAQIANKFGTSDGDLPFLFKVLSIEKALSIQTHPDRATAEKLHAEQPHIYRGAHTRTDLALLAHHKAHRWKPQAGDGDRSDTIFGPLWFPSHRPHRIIFRGGSGVRGVDPGHNPTRVHYFCLLPGRKEGAEGVVHITHDCRGKQIRSGIGDAGWTVQKGTSERNGKTIGRFGDTVTQSIPRRHRSVLPVYAELRGARGGRGDIFGGRRTTRLCFRR